MSPRWIMYGTMPSRKVDRSSAVISCGVPGDVAAVCTAPEGAGDGGRAAELADAGFATGGTCAIAKPVIQVMANAAMDFA